MNDDLMIALVRPQVVAQSKQFGRQSRPALSRDERAPGDVRKQNLFRYILDEVSAPYVFRQIVNVHVPRIRRFERFVRVELVVQVFAGGAVHCDGDLTAVLPHGARSGQLLRVRS